MSFLSPLVLGGLALMALPWLIHRIRRPERETVRFSSLMFVPKARREVIERRRLQHILLMLVRMAALALLALAFARPFREVDAGAVSDASDAGDHVVLFDVSASMSDEIRFEAARQAALRTVSGLPAGSRVAVIAFARAARVHAPLQSTGDAEAGTLDRAREAIRALAPTWEATRYTEGLQAAERELGAAAAPVPRVVHLVSDLQVTGLDAGESGWRLREGIRLQPVPVVPPRDNASVDEVALRRRDDRTEVRARIHNHGEEARPVTVRLLVDGRPPLEESVSIPAGNATQVLFTLSELEPATTLAGRVEIDPDGLPIDNRRYFAWNPPRPRRVGLAAADRSGARLLHAAVPEDGRLPWRLQDLPPDPGASALDDIHVVVVARPGELTEAGRARLLARVEAGAGLLVLPTPDVDPRALEALLGETVRVAGAARPATRSGLFDRITWVDLGHPVFHPFRAPVYNDFSSLRFRNHHRLQPLSPEIAVLARFEPPRTEAGAGDPAIVEIRRGGGRVLVWASGIDPAWSSLPRDPRFVPLLHETLRYLAGEEPTVPALHVGDPVTSPMRALGVPGPWLLDFATGSVPNRIAVGTAERRPLERPGLYTWRSESRPGTARTDAVNLDPRESDPRPLDPSELRLRLTGAEPVLPSEDLLPEQFGETGTRRLEYGRAILLLALLLLSVEFGLTRYYGTRPKAA